MSGYRGSPCVVSPRTDVFELAPDNGLAMPSVMLELGYHDTWDDTVFFELMRVALSEAITDALLECKDGCPVAAGG